MEKFLAIYTVSPKSKNSHQWNALSETDRQARVEKGMEAWGRWAQKYQKYFRSFLILIFSPAIVLKSWNACQYLINKTKIVL